MTYLDPNSGAAPQPGAAIYRGPEAEAARLAEAEEQNVDVAELDEPDAGEGDVDANDEGDANDEEASAPAKSASKGDWVDYAVSQGADREEADSKTKDDLIEAFGD